MQRSFHLYIRRHSNDWYTASVLTHPRYAAFGPSLAPIRQELTDVMAQELGDGALAIRGDTFFDDLQQRVLEIELRAIQHERLVRVPMRFTVLHRTIQKDGDLYEVILPRIGQRFTIHGKDNIMPWAEEIVRGFFHLCEIDKLLAHQYERGARIERLDVVYHGGRRQKKAKGPSQNNRHSITDLSYAQRSPLGAVGVELTEEARAGRLPKVHFRDNIIDELTAILSGSQHKSVLLIGPSGVGKTALVHEVAQRIAAERVHVRLQDIPIWHITGGRIIAGMKFLGQWQERCRTIVEEVRAHRGILYVDNLLELMMSGSATTGLNVARFLLPFVRSGELTVIAEVTPDALIVAEQIESAFVHALRRLPVPSFSTEESYAILELHTRQLGKTHKVNFSAASLSRSLDILARFGDVGSLPGSGLALIEQMARLAPAPKGNVRHELQPIDAVRAFAKASGFPEALIDPDRLLTVDEVHDFFTSKVIGQPDATSLLTNLITIIKASLNDPDRPLGSFLFMGPTGVGKTESALTLAQYLFGDRDRLVRFDMSEYAYPGAAIRLVGGARGEGELTSKVRQQPFCVLLFDELEKADPEVFDILLQVLGEGRLTDGTGRTVRFTHTIVIMTSNLGAARKAPVQILGAKGNTQTHDLHAHYLDAAQRFFRPEFINRIDFMVPFQNLQRPAVRRIATRMLDNALARQGFSRRNITVAYQPDLVDLLMEHGFDPRYGARPMKRAVEQHVLIPLSRRLVRRNQFAQDERFDLYVHEGRVAVVSSRTLNGQTPRAHGPVFEHNNLWRGYLAAVRRRLQDWEESAVLHRLTQNGDPAPRQTLEQLQDDYRALEAQNAEPENLDQDAIDALKSRTARLDDALRELEWALCVAASPQNPAQITLHIESRSVQPISLELVSQLTQALLQWCQWRNLQTQLSHHGDQRKLLVSGPGAHTALQHELGTHRFHLPDIDDPVDLHISLDPEESSTQDPPVREISLEPPTIWDPHTELERPATVAQLADHLDHFLLARMVMALPQNA